MTTIYLFKQIDDSTDYSICPPIEAVFAETSPKHPKFLLPLLTVDLNLINDNWKGKVHFVYNESDSDDYIYYAQDNDAAGLSFRLEDNQYTFEGSFDFDSEDLSEYDCNDGYIQFVELQVPKDSSTWGRVIKSKLEEIEEDEDDLVDYFRGAHLGGQPVWKGEDQTPVNRIGEPMSFIGQLNADDFSDDVESLSLYLFYCPNEQIVTQIHQ